MKASGEWWYDKTGCAGDCISPSANSDMINEGFGTINGSDFKITRSNDSRHQALLTTKSNCLGGNTFRMKITSYGNFR